MLWVARPILELCFGVGDELVGGGGELVALASSVELAGGGGFGERIFESLLAGESSSERELRFGDRVSSWYRRQCRASDLFPS